MISRRRRNLLCTVFSYNQTAQHKPNKTGRELAELKTPTSTLDFTRLYHGYKLLLFTAEF